MQNDGAMLVINRELAVAFQVIGSDERKEFSSWSADQPESPVPPRRAIGGVSSVASVEMTDVSPAAAVRGGDDLLPDHRLGGDTDTDADVDADEGMAVDKPL